MSEAPLLKTPLNSVHRALGAKMVDFGGWDMPVQYSGIIDEHNAVRNSVGIFDVSHMGEIEIHGPEAAKLTDFVTTNNVGKLKHGQAHYSGLLYEHGGFVDDILVHKVEDDHYFLCVNASNQEKDYDHIRARNRFPTAAITWSATSKPNDSLMRPRLSIATSMKPHDERKRIASSMVSPSSSVR